MQTLFPCSPVERRASSLYNRPEGLKDIARGEAPGKWNKVTSPEGAAEKDAEQGFDTYLSWDLPLF
ncbi:MAG: hypothetical protein AAB422_00240 [Planctomycetota bacterium]